MFERIVLHETRRGIPGTAFDFGFLAETMLFYGHTHVIVGRGTLPELVRAFGPETLISYLGDGHMTMTYTPNLLGVIARGAEYDLGLVRIQNHSDLQDAARSSLQELTSRPGHARRLAQKLRDLVREAPLPDDLPARAREEWLDEQHVQQSVAAIMAAFAPGYTLPDPLVFTVEAIANGSFVVETNISFVDANVSHHKIVPSTVSSITPAYLLAALADGRLQIDIASAFEADFATNAVGARVIGDRINRSVSRSSRDPTAEFERFQEVVFGDLGSLRQAINSGERSFIDLLPVLEKAKRFREWIAGKAPNADLLQAYYREVSKESWVEKLPAKPIRFALFTGAGLLLDIAGLGGLGTAAGVALNAGDAFVLDKLLKGWKPNQFIESELKDFLRSGKPPQKPR